MRLSDGRHVDHLQRDRTTGEVAAGARLLSPYDREQLAVEVSRLVEVSHLNVDAKQVWHVRARALLRAGRSYFLRRLFLRRHLFLRRRYQ